MTTKVETLDNGIRVATHAMPGIETVSLGLWVSAGSRHERQEQHGLSHFLEHMAFKGTQTRTARAIAEEIEAVGGELNAATGLDSTAFYARVLKADVGIAMSIIADILLDSKFSADDVQRERIVVQQEIAATDDSPDDIAFDLMQSMAYPGQSLGRPILGTKETVGRFRPADIRAFLDEHYTPESFVISAAGGVHHDDVVRHVQALFGGLTRRPRGVESLAQYRGGHASSNKPFEQSHLLLGLPSPSCREPGFYTAQVFSGLFGWGMSSRLFQEVREDRGLCYSIYSTLWGLKDTGMLAVHAATGAESIDELASVVVAELHKIAETGPSASELHRSKAQLQAGLLMALESSAVRAEQMSRQLLAQNVLISPTELADRVSAVTVDDVRTFARGLLVEAPTVAVVGSGRKSQAQAARVAALFQETATSRAARA